MEINGELKTPKSLKNKISLKTTTIHQLSALAKIFKNYGNDYQILLLTPYGFIKGDVHEIATKENFISENKQENNYTIDLSYVWTMRNEVILKFESENDNQDLTFVDSGAILNLKNVTVFKDNLVNPVLTINQMIVFSDQIISFSLIHRNHNE